MMESQERLLEQFQAALRAKNRQPATVESYARDAQDFLRYLHQSGLGLQAVEPQTLLWFRDHLLHDGKEAENSVRRKVIGVRQFYRFLAEERLILDSPFDAMPLPERDETLKPAVKDSSLERMLEVLPSDNLKNLRDRAILHLLAYEGIKAHELIQLQWIDHIRSSQLNTLSIPGQKARTIALRKESAAHLDRYAESFQAWLKPLTQEQRLRYRWMFVAFKGKDSSLVLPQLTRHGLKFMLHELGDRFGIKQLHTEGLRHHAIQHQLESGKTAEEVMGHLGLRRLGNVGKHLAKRRMKS
ncbi:MAG: tyrosine-type recombinase/integrase [Oligoflexus sp.]|jgi:integrase/recombinase XerD